MCHAQLGSLLLGESNDLNVLSESAAMSSYSLPDKVVACLGPPLIVATGEQRESSATSHCS